VIVFADEEQRQPPQAGHVQRFVEGALVDGPVAEKADHGFRKMAHRDGIGEAESDRIGFADDGISAHEAPLAVEQVHGAAHAAAHAAGAAEQLRHDFASRRSAYQGVRVLAIGADDVIGRFGRVDDARANRLLARIKVKETNDISLAVLLRGPFLEGSGQQHVTKQAV